MRCWHSKRNLTPGVVVTGEGIVSVTPDYARIESGVTTRAKAAKDAVDGKFEADGRGHLSASGVRDRRKRCPDLAICSPADLRPWEPRAEPKLVGYSVSNRVRVNFR
jgi:uncharacterized protein